MSQSLEYASRFSGSVSDKCTCHIVSLDFDFLERVSNWIAETYPDQEIFGPFARDKIRAVEYVSNGRYRMTVTCAQNKAGIAAKAALLAQFFNPDGSRKDLSPEDEESWILAEITAGKAADPGKESIPCAANHSNQSPTPTAAPSQSPSPGTAPGVSTGTSAPGGREEETMAKRSYMSTTDMIYAVRQQPDGVYRIMCHYDGEEWAITTDPALSAACNCAESLQEVLDAYALRKGWKEIDMECKEKNPKPAPNTDAAATTAAPAVESLEISTTLENEADAKESSLYSSGDADAASSSGLRSPAEQAPATQSLSNASNVCLEAEPERPEFDYSALPENTAQRLRKLADRALRLHRNYYLDLMEIVVEAHRELCGTVVPVGDNGRFAPKDDTFRCWCSSVGINKTKAYQLLQIQYIMDNSTPSEQEYLAELPFTVMREIAKTSTPPEILQAARQGDITNNKQYQELMAQLKAKNDEVAAANARADGLAEEVNAREAKITELLDANEAADRRAEKAEAERDAARKEKAGLAADCNRIGRKNAELAKELEGSRQVAAAERSRAEHWKEKAEAMTRQAGAAPIEAKVVDADEVERLAAEKAYQMAADMTADQREKAARDAYDAFILAGRSLDALWQSLAPRLPQLEPRQRSAAVEPFVQKLMFIKEEIYRVK